MRQMARDREHRPSYHLALIVHLDNRTPSATQSFDRRRKARPVDVQVSPKVVGIHALLPPRQRTLKALCGQGGLVKRAREDCARPEAVALVNSVAANFSPQPRWHDRFDCVPGCWTAVNPVKEGVALGATRWASITHAVTPSTSSLHRHHRPHCGGFGRSTLLRRQGPPFL